MYFYLSSGRGDLQKDSCGDKDQLPQFSMPEAGLLMEDTRWPDISTSMTYVLSLAHAAGTRIRHISTIRDWLGIFSFEGS